jgi:leucyl aminopeptidase (aminopeptidase T)
MTDADLRAPAETAVHQCLDLQPDESCLVVTDDGCEPIGRALYETARAVTGDAVFLQYPPLDQHGEEPDEMVAAALRSADAFLAPTTMSLSHTRARSEATEAGARGATLPDITREVFTTGLDADYDEIQRACEAMLETVADAEEVRLTSPQGTDITFGFEGREWLDDTGDVSEPGSFSNLPAGEVFVSPATADGRFVVDGTIRPHGRLEPGHEVTVEVEDAYVTDIDDTEVAAMFEEAAEEVGQDAYNLAELGIGTNVAVTDLVGSVLLDEKAGGTVHVAVGDDAGIGGDTSAPIHQDGILTEPTVSVDGEVVDLPTVER